MRQLKAMMGKETTRKNHKGRTWKKMQNCEQTIKNWKGAKNRREGMYQTKRRRRSRKKRSSEEEPQEDAKARAATICGRPPLPLHHVAPLNKIYVRPLEDPP